MLEYTKSIQNLHEINKIHSVHNEIRSEEEDAVAQTLEDAGAGEEDVVAQIEKTRTTVATSLTDADTEGDILDRRCKKGECESPGKKESAIAGDKKKFPEETAGIGNRDGG